MWIFLTSGLIMPVVTDKRCDPKLTDNGRLDMQVRGRLTAHLKRFISDYMDPYGLEHSKIEQTPTHDYTCRFYCTADAFAAAMGYAVKDIDYRHFKDRSTDKTPEGTYKYKFAERYHSLLLRIWGASLDLNPEEGLYGTKAWSKYKRRGKRYSLADAYADADRMEEDAYGFSESPSNGLLYDGHGAVYLPSSEREYETT